MSRPNHRPKSAPSARESEAELIDVDVDSGHRGLVDDGAREAERVVLHGGLVLAGAAAAAVTQDADRQRAHRDALLEEPHVPHVIAEVWPAQHAKGRSEKRGGMRVAGSHGPCLGWKGGFERRARTAGGQHARVDHSIVPCPRRAPYRERRGRWCRRA